MPVKINGATNGSVTLAAPATGSDVTVTLPAAAGTVATQAYADTAGGLVLITSETFSAVSSVSVNGCFTSQYKDYLVRINCIAATGSPSLLIRTRSAGTDETGSNYHRQRFIADGGAVSCTRASSQTSGEMGFMRQVNQAFDFTVANPQVAVVTNIYTSNVVGYAAGDVTTPTVEGYGNVLNNTTAYDGFTLLPASSTITGTVRIYGFKD
jgi:hypothetical protein